MKWDKNVYKCLEAEQPHGIVDKFPFVIHTPRPIIPSRAPKTQLNDEQRLSASCNIGE